MNRKHWGQHDDSCFACRIQSITYSPTCFPSTPGGRKVASTIKSEKQLTRDLASFKRLTQGGTMPKGIDGSARLEAEARVPYEIESGQLARTRAKGPDASRGGREWARRAQDAHSAIRRGEVVEA